MWEGGRKGFYACVCVCVFFVYFFCYAVETNLRFIYYIPEICRSSYNVWDYALCDII